MDDLDAVGRAGARWSRPTRAATCGASAATASVEPLLVPARPGRDFAEYSSDLDVIADDEAWKVAASTSVHPLAAWGPPVPPDFLAPPDIVALTRG
jgi:hypothetical protein